MRTKYIKYVVFRTVLGMTGVVAVIIIYVAAVVIILAEWKGK